MIQENFSWADGALCKGQPTEWWFPVDHNTRENRQFIVQAKTICNICKVKQECLSSAIKNSELFGIWGGKTPSERGISRNRRVKVSVSK